MRYEVLSREARIGWSELEFGDPPMGVAHGRFHPSDLYQSARHAGPNADLRARPEGSDEYFQPAGGVLIEDLSSEFGPEGIEVTVLGLDAATYQRFFPQLVKTHEDQFRPKLIPAVRGARREPGCRRFPRPPLALSPSEPSYCGALSPSRAACRPHGRQVVGARS
jgi:hypothetical protein